MATPPDETSVRARVRELLAQTLPLADLSNHEPFASLPGWDSLRHAQFIIAVQKFFKIRFTPHEIVTLNSVDQVVHCLSHRGSDTKT